MEDSRSTAAQLDGHDAPEDTEDGEQFRPLFRRGAHPEKEARLGLPGYEDWLIGGGFLVAAGALVRSLERDNLHKDFLVYPIVWGYRQYVELALKTLIHGLLSIVDYEDPDSVAAVISHSHDLAQLLEIVKQGLRILGCGFDSDDELELAGRRIVELHEKDPKAFAFRYARDRSGQRYIEPTAFDIGAFAAEMDSVADRLDRLMYEVAEAKFARLESWGDNVDRKIKDKTRATGLPSDEIRMMSGGLQVQWTRAETRDWATCQLREDKRIQIVCSRSTRDRGADSLSERIMEQADVEGAAETVVEFLMGPDNSPP